LVSPGWTQTAVVGAQPPDLLRELELESNCWRFFSKTTPTRDNPTDVRLRRHRHQRKRRRDAFEKEREGEREREGEMERCV
jgi:hypothetical protein